MSFVWASHEVDTLRAMREAGHTIAAIARQLPGRSPMSVRIHARRLGLTDPGAANHRWGNVTCTRAIPKRADKEFTRLMAGRLYEDRCRPSKP